MSYIFLSDRVKEISYTTGIGSLELEGAVQGFSSFSSAYSDGDNLFYAITDGTRYEVGSGLYFSNVIDGTGIARFPISTSNGNLLVDFPTGLKEVFVTYPGSHSVYHASGYATAEAPSASGIAFWLSNNVIGYDSSFVWDNTNSRIGINTASPAYAIDLGGDAPEAIIKASGLIAASSGVFFPFANNGDSAYLGGRQLVHFDPNDVLDSDAKTVIGVSGQVNQYIYLHEQPKGFVLAGPPSGCGVGCLPAVPQFRPLSVEDIPNLDSLYATFGSLEAASGTLFSDILGVSGDLLMVSGAMVVVSGMAAFDLAVSGILNSRLEEVSGIIISSGTQFISDLEAASGELDSRIMDVSGIIIASGTQFILDLEAASGELSDRIMDVSGIIIASGTQFLSDLEAASGELSDRIMEVSGYMVASGTQFLSDLEAASGELSDRIMDVSGIVISSGTQFLLDLEAASGELSDRIMDVSGIIISSGTRFISDLEAASGSLFSDIEGVSGDLLMVSGAVVVVSGMVDDLTSGGGITLNQSMTATSGIVIASGTQFVLDLQAASGELSDRIMDVSGIIISSGTQFISDLEAASGELSDRIMEVSGYMIASGTQFISDLEAASGELSDRIMDVSGIIIASGTQFLSDLEVASGSLFSDIQGVSGDLLMVSGAVVVVSGMVDDLGSGGGISLNDSMNATSGIVIASGTSLFNAIEGSSGVFNRLIVNMSNTAVNEAVISNTDGGEPTHFRIINTSGIGSRLLLTSSSGDLGNTWANVSLSDGGYRVFNYTYNWDVPFSGFLPGGAGYLEMPLDSGIAYRELLPMSLIGASISGSFLNYGHPSGALITNQYPASGHVLRVEAHPGQSLLTGSTQVPAIVSISSLGVNGMSVSENNQVGFNLDPSAITSDVDIRGESVRIRNSGIISGSSSPGYQGEIKWDSSFIYVCVANNTWKRAALGSW